MARSARGIQIKHGRLRRSRPVPTFLRLIGVVAAVAVVSSVGVAAYATHDVIQSTQPPVTIPVLPGHTAEPLPEAPAGQAVGEVNMLLVGTDTRENQGPDYQDAADQAASSGAGNNDVNILLHISRDHSSISVVSFPRDLMIPMPSCPTASGGSSYASSKAMLNTALSRGGDSRYGLACAVLTIEQLTGLDIPYAASVTFDGTAAISSAIGGVTVCLATPIVDPNTKPPLDLEAGEQTLVGGQALSFLRSRHGVGDGSDLGRISNQQVFMSALARQLSSSSTYSNPFKLYAMASAASKNMLLSSTLNVKTLLGIVEAVQKVGLANMVFVQYPTGLDPDNSNRVVPSTWAASQLTQALIADQPLVLSGTTGDASQLDPGDTATATAPSTGAGGGGSAGGATTGTGTGTGSGGTGTGSTSTPSATSGSQSSGSTATGGAGSGEPSAAVTLPPTVTGQTAAQKTCSVKRY